MSRVVFMHKVYRFLYDRGSRSRRSPGEDGAADPGAVVASKLSLTRGIDLPKSSPELIVRRTLDALEAGAEEVLADERARQLKQGLSAEPGVYLLDPSAAAPVAAAR